MSARAGVWVIPAASLVVAMGGCIEPAPSGPDECALAGEPLHTGALFDVVGFGDVEICEGSLAEAEAHAAWVAEVWGETPDVFEYRLYASRDHSCWPCEGLHFSFGACAKSGYLATTRAADLHELTHSVRPGTCASLIEEGWATLFGDHFLQSDTVGTLADVADAGRSAPGFYPFAARFVAFVTDTYGLDAVKALCVHPIVDAASLDAALQAELGQTLDAVSAQLDAYPQWELGELRQDRACEFGDAPLLSPGVWTFDLRCGAPGASGQPGGAMMAAQEIELPEFGAYSFDFAPAAGSPTDYSLRYELRSCAREGMASVYFTHGLVHSKMDGSGNISLYELPAGTYVLRVMLEDTAEPVTLAASVERWF